MLEEKGVKALIPDARVKKAFGKILESYTVIYDIISEAYMKFLQQNSICSACCWFSSLPELLLRGVAIRRAYLEQAVWNLTE